MTDANQELHQIATTVFEEVGFLFPTAEPQPSESREDPLQAAISVSFSGAADGRLVLAAFGSLLPTLASNMLGEDEPPSHKQQEDALGEIANIICGNVLPKVLGKSNVFRLQAPQLIGADGLSARPGEECLAKAEVYLEEGFARLALFAGAKQ
ncbi:MAG: chemotaxis protein CheX [Armatimonadota bacterium]|nr:chemotaxis protein CheX [Armatimonadota bacterium]